MSSLFSQVVCLACGHMMPADPLLTKCERCKGVWLDARYDYDQVRWSKQGIKTGPASLWRYNALLPLTDPEARVSIGEGWTPIIKANRLGEALDHQHIYIKDERRNPTNSFKDRQGALSVSVLKQEGIRECVLASTGNAAAAYAAYCAHANIKLWVFLTSMVPAEKMRELGLYGAELIKVTGTYDQAKQVATDFAARRGLYLDRGAKGVIGKESMKTMAFEIAEQLGLMLTNGKQWLAPDWYVQAVSGGIGPLGVQKGFEELFYLGLIDKIPKLAIVQSEGCSPMVSAFERGQNVAEPVVPNTLITVLATGDPGHAYTVLYEKVMTYGGIMVSVDDGQAFRAMRRLARTEGFSVEPATAVAFAGLEKLIASDIIGPDETVLINCSGHTFPAEKHILEEQYVLELDLGAATPLQQFEGLGAALERLDEQIMTVVVIDDNPNDTRLIRRLLQAHKNYRVFETNNPLDGLDLVKQRQPDLIITDLTMPQMDGFQLVEDLKNDPQTTHIPVIVLSGKDLSSADKARLDGRIEMSFVKGKYRTGDLVDQIVNRVDSEGREKRERATQAQMPTPTTETPAESSLPRVLIVDDNPYDSRLLRKIIESGKQYQVQEIRRGQEVLEYVRVHRPSLVILDLMLPDLNGFEVLNRLRNNKDTYTVKVILMTNKEITQQDRARLLGAVYLPKAGVSRQLLLDTIRGLIG
jgi:threonine synthase